MRLDPMQRGRDFTTGQHPRRGQKSTQRQLAEVNTRLTTAFDAFGGGGGGGSGLVLDGLPEVDASYIGKTVVVRTTAGQPAGVYTGSQDAFDNPVWVRQAVDDPAAFAYQYAFAPNPSPSFADFAVGIAVTPRRIFVAYRNPAGGGYVTENTLDGSYVQIVSFGSTPEFPSRMSYDGINQRIAMPGKAGPPFLVAFQIWNSTLTSLVATVGASGTSNGQFGSVADVAADSSGNWYAFDNAAAPRVQKFTPAGSYTTKWGAAGAGAGEFTASSDHSLTIDSDGTVHVLDVAQCRVQRFSNTGTYLSSYGAPGVGPGQFVTPHTIRATAYGAILVTDSGNKSILVFANNGSFVTRFATAQDGFSAGLLKGIAERNGTVWVVNSLHSDNSVSVWRQGGGSVSPVVTLRTNSTTVANGGSGSVSVTCNAGEAVTGGGCQIDAGNVSTPVARSRVDANGFTCTYGNTSGATRTITAQAVCTLFPT